MGRLESTAGDRRAAQRLSALLCAASIVLAVVGSASANPMIPDQPVLSDPSVTRLSLGTGAEDYTFRFTDAVIDPGWSNQRGDTVTIFAEIRFGEAIVASALETMMVFTSIRIGSADVNCGNLSPGGGLAFASLVVAPGSFGGQIARSASATDSQVGGRSKVCNAEDAVAPFQAAVFEGAQESYAFSFKLATTKDGIDTGEFQKLRFMGQAYVAPEPGTGLLVLLGLVGMAGASRRRLAQR